METLTLVALNENFEQVSFLAPSNIQWNRKYYEVGDFSIQIFQEDYDDTFKYIYTAERKEMGIIEKVTFNSDTGRYVQLEGRFIEQLLNDKITYPTFYGNGETSAVIAQMVNQYKEDIPVVVVNGAKGENIKFQSTGDEVGIKIASLLKQQQMAYKMEFNFLDNQIEFSIFKGKSRTSNSNDGMIVTYSTRYGNLINVNATTDDSNFKNYAVVGGQGQGIDRIFEVVDLSNGGYKKKLFVNASHLSNKENQEEYRQELRNEGLTKLLDYQNVKNVMFDSLVGDYNYLVDYDLGTVCDIIIDDIKLSMEARIIGIYEVFKESQHTITLEFGDKILTNYEKARLK